MIWLIVGTLALVLAACALFAWELHVHYGPIYWGNARWRREAPRRAAEQAEREVLSALTPDDRTWLEAAGWKDPRGGLRYPLSR